MAPTTIPEPTPTPTYLNKKAFTKNAKVHTGPSPHAEKPTDESAVEFNGGLEKTGALDKAYEYEDVTPVIGRQYANAQLSEIVKNKEQLRDLAITISQRGVVFFKDQDISIADQKILADELGRVTGKPKSSGLHIHPTAPAGGFLKDGTEEIDPEVSIISSKLASKIYKDRKVRPRQNNRETHGWHSDITFEPVPSDYAILKIVDTPPAGGDTLWASGYAVYDLLSESFRNYLSGLTGTYTQPYFKESSEKNDFDFYSGPRGSPENIGDELTAKHPIVRTNPVSGWNSIFAVGEHYTNINEVSDKESRIISQYIQDLIFQHHEIRVRYKWGKNDVAIWDNRSVYHNATRDVFTLPGDVNRLGVRTVGIGERPFYSPKGKSRSEELDSKQGEGKNDWYN